MGAGVTLFAKIQAINSDAAVAPLPPNTRLPANKSLHASKAASNSGVRVPFNSGGISGRVPFESGRVPLESIMVMFEGSVGSCKKRGV